ncbi:MAG TPA: hypothetical protein VMD74_02815 [Candidatus Methylomirabilis sp.]|nr:hypothetical protein [Candidatus Methylomirabilis sp.]
MENCLPFQSKQFRFFYGAMRLAATNNKRERTEKYYPCLFDLKKGIILKFDAPAQLGQAIRTLISPVESESVHYRFEQVFPKRNTCEIRLEDWEDYCEAQDALEESDAGTSFLDFTSEAAMQNDRERRSFQNFKRLHEEHLWEVAEEKAELKKIATAIRKLSKKRRLVKNHRSLHYIEKTDHEGVLRILPDPGSDSRPRQYMEGVAPTAAYYLRDFEEVEKPGILCGPYYFEKDFTDDLEYLPPKLRPMFVNFNVLEAIGHVIRNEVDAAFHPEKSAAKGAKGCVEMSSQESMTAAALLSDSTSV